MQSMHCGRSALKARTSSCALTSLTILLERQHIKRNVIQQRRLIHQQYTMSHII